MGCLWGRPLSGECRGLKAEPEAGLSSSESQDSVTERQDEKTLQSGYRKADLRLILWYSLVFFFLKIEAHNITNAAIMNVEAGTDIQLQLGNLTSEQWAMGISALFYPILVFEPISNFLLTRFSPRVWISRITLTWGIIAMCHGAMQNFGGLIACRVLLGLAEAGFFPGVLYHLSFWYPTSRLPLRIAFFAASGAAAGAVSGLLAYAISFLNGIGGLAGWRYLFIIEGAPAILCAVYTWIALPNYPESATFLTEDERRCILRALPKTQPRADDDWCKLDEIKAGLKDSTTYTFFLTWACHAIGSKGVSTVLPSVLFSLGMTGTGITQLLTMPPYLVGAVSVVLIAWLIRKDKVNCWLASLSLEAFGCICYGVLIAVENPAVKYAFVILATSSSMAVLPILWPERIRVARGSSSAALGIGLTSAAPVLTGVVGPYVYQKKFGPTYRVSFMVSVGLLCTVIVCILTTWCIIKVRDKRSAREHDEK